MYSKIMSDWILKLLYCETHVKIGPRQPGLTVISYSMYSIYSDVPVCVASTVYCTLTFQT